MDIRVLRYFLAVAREQSFSTAAEKLFLSQPTLSRQLKELEVELGKTLLVRSNKGITLAEQKFLNFRITRGFFFHIVFTVFSALFRFVLSFI